MDLRQIAKKATLLIFFAFLSLQFFAQDNCNYQRPHQTDNWIFGEQAGLYFDSAGVIAAPTAKSFALPNGVSSMSDNNGNLLMFSNGLKVWNGDYEVIPNGDVLKGNNYATQSSLIVPHPGDRRKYYLFTVDMYIPPFFSDGVNYSIVDLTDGNFGQVTNKNTFLHSENAQKITGTIHDNGTDYWVVTHGFGPGTGNTFYSYLVSDTGLVENPVISTTGTVHQGGDNNSAGYMKISPDGTTLALVIPLDGIVELFDFNPEDGRVSNPRTSSGGRFNYGFGVEFSPDNSKLYISTNPLGNDTSYLYQLDLSAGDPFSTPFVVEKYAVQQLRSADSLMGGLQLGTDGRIYMAKFRRGLVSSAYIGVIYNPNRPGDACNYNSLNYQSNNGLSLAGGGSLFSLPNFVTSFLDIPHFTYINQCHQDTTLFSITNTANIDNTTWEFDDDEGEQVIFDPLNPGYVFDEPGDYTVELTETFDDADYLTSRSVRVHPRPFVDLGKGTDTLYILPNTSVVLDAGTWDYYYWQPSGSTQRYLEASQEGLYQVTVVDSNCCSSTDQVYVMVTELYFPNAFRPESSIPQNSTFRVVGNISALGGYVLQIFDRWGGMIFESENPAEGWDGTSGGKPMPVGTYVYRAVFQGFDTDDSPGTEFKYNGTVTLVR
jgi:gliding motility-associated-like protein